MTGVELKLRGFRSRINRAVEIHARVLRHSLQNEAEVLLRFGYEPEELAIRTDASFEVPCHIVPRKLLNTAAT